MKAVHLRNHVRTAIREPRLYLPIPNAFAEKCDLLTYREIRKFPNLEWILTERYGSAHGSNLYSSAGKVPHAPVLNVSPTSSHVSTTSRTIVRAIVSRSSRRKRENCHI